MDGKAVDLSFRELRNFVIVSGVGEAIWSEL